MIAGVPRLQVGRVAVGPPAFSLPTRREPSLLQYLHHRGRSSDLRHNNVSHDHESITPPRLFQNREEAVAAARAAQKRQSPVARPGDKVQVIAAVTAMQSAGHSKLHGTGGSATRPWQDRKDEAPTVSERER